MQNRSKYFLNNKEVSEEAFYSSKNLSVSNPFRGEKQVNQAVKEAIGLSTRHKAGEKMIYLDEAIEQSQKDDTITNVSRGEKEVFKGFFADESLAQETAKQIRQAVVRERERLALVEKPTAINKSETISTFFQPENSIEQEKKLNEIRELAKHGIKETEGKADYSEINLNILDLMSERMQKNKYKYPPGNSKKPIDLKSLEWALFRHVKKMVQPIENDPESYTEHLAAILCNSSIILDQLELKNE
jgi:hypothetical protein